MSLEEINNLLDNSRFKNIILNGPPGLANSYNLNDKITTEWINSQHIGELKKVTEILYRTNKYISYSDIKKRVKILIHDFFNQLDNREYIIKIPSNNNKSNYILTLLFILELRLLGYKDPIEIVTPISLKKKIHDIISSHKIEDVVTVEIDDIDYSGSQAGASLSSGTQPDDPVKFVLRLIRSPESYIRFKRDPKINYLISNNKLILLESEILEPLETEIMNLGYSESEMNNIMCSMKRLFCGIYHQDEAGNICVCSNINIYLDWKLADFISTISLVPFLTGIVPVNSTYQYSIMPRFEPKTYIDVSKKNLEKISIHILRMFYNKLQKFYDLPPLPATSQDERNFLINIAREYNGILPQDQEVINFYSGTDDCQENCPDNFSEYFKEYNKDCTENIKNETAKQILCVKKFDSPENIQFWPIMRNVPYHLFLEKVFKELINKNISIININHITEMVQNIDPKYRYPLSWYKYTNKIIDNNFDFSDYIFDEKTQITKLIQVIDKYSNWLNIDSQNLKDYLKNNYIETSEDYVNRTLLAPKKYGGKLNISKQTKKKHTKKSIKRKRKTKNSN